MADVKLEVIRIAMKGGLLFLETSKQAIPENILACGTTYLDASSLPPIECHAVRHLYFLLHADEEIAAVPNLEKFWEFAHEVVDLHNPAVVGFVGSNFSNTH